MRYQPLPLCCFLVLFYSPLSLHNPNHPPRSKNPSKWSSPQNPSSSRPATSSLLLSPLSSSATPSTRPPSPPSRSPTAWFSSVSSGKTTKAGPTSTLATVSSSTPLSVPTRVVSGYTPASTFPSSSS